MLIEQTLFGTIDKVADAIALLREHEPQEGYYLCFSGGKDSVTIKALAQMAGVKFDAHYNDTTVDPPQVQAFIRQYHPDVIWHEPKYSMAELIIKKKIPPVRTVRYCCRYLKKHGGKGRVKITGVRRAESKARSRYTNVDFVDEDKNVLPIVTWKDADVWQFIKENHIPYCGLYNKGFNRIGCVLCPYESANKIAVDLELFPEIVNVYRQACRKSFEVNRNHFKHANDVSSRWNSGDDLFNWWLYERRNRRDKGSFDLFKE